MGKFKAFSALKSLCEIQTNHKLISDLKPYLRQKSWTKIDRQLVLNALAEALLDRELRPQIGRLFAPILIELLNRIKNKTEIRAELFIGTSDLIGYYTSATHFAYECFQSSIFCPNSYIERSNSDQSVLDLLVSSFNYLHYHPIWFRDAIDWSFVLRYTSNPNLDIRYISIQLYLILFGLSDTQFDTLFKHTFNAEELIRLRVKYLYLFSPRIPTTQMTDCLYYEKTEDQLLSDDLDQCFVDKDFSADIISVYGVLINKYKNSNSNQSNNFVDKNKIVLVSTTQSNIGSLALAVSYGKPVLIEGPVGCGKTLLIEYMASLTGRHKAPELLKVQMGDQIDAKILIGSHICTDIPGEFIWKAGPLTQAMKHGFWLLLEDIDCAPADVISMLSSVLEAKSLSSLPGCENHLNRVHNEFRLFFTRRLISAQNIESKHSEFAIKSSNHYNCINKLCSKISLDLLNREELSTLISTKWQSLRLICDRILDIYYYLQNEDSDNYGLKRQVSLRDLMKWCQRISKNFVLNSDESALSAFLDANDCFLQCISSPTLRITKSELIGSYLNITRSQSEYLCAKRKPEFLLNEKLFKIGRISVKLKERTFNPLEEQKQFHSFALTQQSLSLLERISVAVDNSEPILLCGETGTGKTSSVQYLANRLHKSLTVINMNQQSDSSDLLGGYKPIEMKVLMQPIKDEYLDLFSKTFELEKNEKFLKNFVQKFKSQEWSTLFKVILRVYESALTKAKEDLVLNRWKALAQRITRLQSNKLNEKGCLAFSFIEGSVVKAMRSGDWVLLDEINLAESETLQCLSAILDTHDDSVILLDKADGLPVTRHSDFRLFACMNPATDVGKKELPLGIRNRLTEFFVDELEDKSDLRILIHSYVGKYVSPNLIESIVDFYLQIKIDAKQSLTDTNGMRPHYSLRTLCRALSVAATNPCGIALRSLYESFCLSFLTRLDKISRMKVENEIIKTLFGTKDSKSLLKAKIEAPKAVDKYELIEGFYVLKGSKEPKTDVSYILTETVKKNLKDICRIVSIGKSFPILLEGETSVGKTSLIEWLAKATGNVCVRVNNHEHTDLQEYIGSYCANADGRLVFREGILAEAMRNGFWIILDELNLAPTEVLEALNRVLDDNRELFIPETQQLIKANPKFLLLATQNPAGHYGGRKVLSRAFRNRFVELHFDSIPNDELEIILHQRCTLPMSYAKRMVGVLVDLQLRRRESGVFAGKHGFITLRDLFRWGERYNKFAKQQNKEIKFYDWDLHLAQVGYMLLAGRVRRPEEMVLIQSVIETRFKRKLDSNAIFSETSFLNNFGVFPEEFRHIVWNKSFKRLGTLLSEAIKYDEPVLLIGETGCGKTSICQLFAVLNNRQLYSVNCHMNTESADFLGSLRPVRNFTNENDDQTSRPLFEWINGPLVDAMSSGAFFLVDEISLADDSVLERLNSVLESERTILIAENNNSLKDDISIPVIKAKESFRYLATMNPGGDYGKRELSPALRNRFTEIWCSPYDDITDIKEIICHNLDKQWIQFKDSVCQLICDFLLWFNSNVFNSKRIVLSIRDVLSWTQFMNNSTKPDNAIQLSLSDSFINGALLVFVDAIGSASSLFSINTKSLNAIRVQCDQYLKHLSESVFGINSNSNQYSDTILNPNKYFAINPFCIPKGPEVDLTIDDQYMWNSPTVQTNCLRLLRAMQLPKPILLEGMPGVGKTSLVQALAKKSGYRLIRINLSEQTDISDLFGADLPIEGQDSAGKFVFREGPLLQALRSEWTWIVFDELNLATQSALEGLNACLDHRSEIFISELNRSFKISKTMTRIFATQNPYSEGGARKGLPRSFLNRFTSVYMERLSTEDYIFILLHMFPKLDKSLIKQMVDFNTEVIDEIVVQNKFGRRGSPWEFNLRELIRWSQVMTQNVSDFSQIKLEKYVKFLYIDKMRTIEDRIKMRELCEKHFNYSTNKDKIDFKITNSYLQIGHSFLERRRILSNEMINYMLFESQKECLESLMKCIEMNWMSILIGESGVGKTSVVKMLSDLTGHKLHVFAVNSEMDTMDLLGGFAQKDLEHHLTNIEDSLIIFCSKVFGKTFEQKEKTEEIVKLWFRVQNLNTISDYTDELSIKKLNLLNKIVDILSEVSVEVEMISNLKQEINQLKSNYENKVLFSGSFEWRDSILIRALTNGEWLLIDNANLCSPSVLDRLNGLLEPNGELTINEKGSIDGQMTTIRPHPDFRLILAMDPINGELSRAMRNRGIEVNMFSISLKEDFIKLINSLVISDDNSREILINCFEELFDKQNEKFSFSMFAESIKSFIFQLQNGFKPEMCLKEFCRKFCVHSANIEEIEILINKIVSMAYKMNDFKPKTKLYLNHFKYDATTSCALEDSQLLDSLLKQTEDSFESNEKYSTALRIYLEKSSFKDNEIRNYIFKKYSLNQSFEKNTELVKQIENNIRKLVPQSAQLNILTEFQIDLRFNSNIWQLYLNLNQFCDNNVSTKVLIEKSLNRYLMNLFWCQLKCNQMNTNEGNGKDIVSFVQICSDIINNKIPRNSFPKAFVPIYNIINEIEDKLINCSLELCPTNDDFMTLRDIILWIHQLFTICNQNSSKSEISNKFITNKFIVLWIVINEKSLSILESFLDIDLNSGITLVNQLLQIENLNYDKKRHKLLLSLTDTSLVFKTEDSAALYRSYCQLINDLFKTSQTVSSVSKDSILLIAKNICALISGHYNRLHLEKDISFIEQTVKYSLNYDMESEDDKELVDAITKRKSMANIQLEPIFLYSLFYSELSHLNNEFSHRFEHYLKLIESKFLSLHPLHISAIILAQNSTQISTDLILYHFIDFNHKFKINNLLTHLSHNSKDIKTFEKKIFDEKLFELSAECLPFISLSSSYLLSSQHNSIGLLNEKLCQLFRLKQFLTLNFELIYDFGNKSFAKLQFEFIRKWFSSLVQNVCLNSPIKKSSLNVRTDSFNQLFNYILLLIEESKDTFDESIVSIFVGLITSHLLCPTYPIDPIERINCKLSHYIIDLKLINAELEVRNALAIIRSNSSSVEECDHSLVLELVERKKCLEQKIKKFDSKLPFRSSSSDYFKLKSDCNLFLETIINRKTIENYSKKFITLYREENREKISNDQKTIGKLHKSLIQDSINFQTSITSFIRQIQSTYPLYQDLVNVFLIGVSILLKGFKSATFLLQNQNFVINDLKFNFVSDITTIFKTVGNYCNTDSPAFIANYLCNSETISKFTTLSNFSKLDIETNISTLLRSALLEMQNEMVLNYNSSLQSVSIRIFNVFVKCWQNLRKDEENKRSEEESLFQYRMKSHESELSEEESDRKELELIFPTFHDQYIHFIDGFAVEDTNKINLIESKSENDIISDIISSHSKLFEPMDTTIESVPDFRKCYVLRHSLLTQITKSLGIFFDNSIDCELIEGQMIVCNEMIANISNISSVDSFNIYHNSSISETSLCFKILETLEKRIISELLPQFESHPILIKLLKIIKTIFDFNSNDPLIKFATGLEVLLQSAQDWQLMAHRGISLVDNLNQITQLVISWRKLELKYWSECLDSVNRNIESKQINKFWFHLYITITALIESKSIKDSIDCNQNQIKEFVVSIKQFIETSKLGEFRVRLNLLRTFMFHVLCVDSNTNSLFISLQNLYKFYSQFVPNIETVLTNVRNPIEKEVKEFVRITKWNDNNFWSVKSAVDKSHKQLYKYMKKYESELNQTVASHLNLENSENKTSFSNWELKLNFAKQFANEVEKCEPVCDLFINYSFLQKSLTLITKSNRLAKRTVRKSSIIVNRINAIESFSNEIIIGIKELSELQVPIDIKDKTKWKKSANHIHNRKRRALSELFKSLTLFGLSYRKGLIIDNDFDINQIIITTRPLDYSGQQSAQLLHQLEEDISCCDKYFYKCLARFASLRIGLESPNKQLPIGTVDRIKGFATQLLKTVINKRNFISDNLIIYNRFKSIQQNLNNFSKNNVLMLIIPKREFDKHLGSAQDLIVRIISFIFRSIDLVNSLSASIEEPVLLLSNDQKFNICEQTVSEFKHSLVVYNSKLNEVIKTLKTLKSNEENSVYSVEDLHQFMDISNTLSSVMSDLKELFSNQNFCCAFSLEKKFSILFDEITLLTKNFNQFSDNYNKSFANFNTVNEIEGTIDSIAKYSVKSVKIILLSIEKIYKSFNDLKIEESNEDLLEDSMNSTELKNVFNDFQPKNIFKTISLLLKLINSNSESNENSEKELSVLQAKTQILRTISPIIDIYVKFFEYFFILSMASLRTSNKLLQILLSLFSELIQNGFCLPLELSDETEDKDMGTELKSVEDGGLGEGEGTKDVSDKIESEDQLEDALKDGVKQEKTEEDNERDIEEEDNGIEMENDFDGQAYSPAKGDDNEDDREESDENEDDLEDQMGDIDNNSDVLDEKIWGSDEEDVDSDDSEGEDETGFGGKDSIDTKFVAKDENKDLPKDDDLNEKPEKDKNEDELEINENENEVQNDEYEDERIDPYKQIETKTDKSKQELPENMELDDKEDDDQKDEMPEDVDNISLSDQSSSDEEKHSETEEQNVEENEEIFEDNQMDENESKTEEIENKAEVNEDKEEENETKDTNLNTNPNMNKESVDLNNEQIFGSDNSEKMLENQTNAKNSTDVCVEESVEQNGDQSVEQSEEQHGLSEAQMGDNSTQSEAQPLQSSTTSDENMAKEERFRQNNRKDKTRRTLAENYDNTAKRQKVIPNEIEETFDSDVNNKNKFENRTISTELYRHVDSELKANNKVIDIASNDEKLIQNEELNRETEDDIDLDKPEEMEIEEKSKSVEELKAIDVKSEINKLKSSSKSESNKEDPEEEVMEIEGEIVPTLTVQRGNESTFHTSLDSNRLIESNETPITGEKRLDELLVKMFNNIDIDSVIEVWRECESKVAPLVYELCERLQLVLEPTKTAKLKGDYRTGKRLNMRKVIAYIASDFRKDKIWLRRTKPSKRQYQIVIAVDDSSSMSDNKSKQLAFESLALLGKSLSLLEVGELAIMSFGQTVNLLHKFDEPFNDNTGAHLLTQFTFNQSQTRIADLLLSVIELMSSSRRTTGSSQRPDISQLLVIVSDGRGIYSEGEQKVKQSIRKMKELAIFMVFIVIDNPLSKDSILDIRVPLFDDSGNVRIESYLSRFPFPFYILLRDINGLPVVMGEALRQWFELITSGQT